MAKLEDFKKIAVEYGYDFVEISCPDGLCFNDILSRINDGKKIVNTTKTIAYSMHKDIHYVGKMLQDLHGCILPPGVIDDPQTMLQFMRLVGYGGARSGVMLMDAYTLALLDMTKASLRSFKKDLEQKKNQEPIECCVCYVNCRKGTSFSCTSCQGALCGACHYQVRKRHLKCPTCRA